LLAEGYQKQKDSFIENKEIAIKVGYHTVEE
jgi:hypothetical protein